MSKPTIITASGKARHGKDTFCNMLADGLRTHGKKVLRIAYGDYLKYIALNYMGWNGEKDEAGRTLLQTLGTEKVRSKDPDFWVDTVIRLIDVIGDEFDYVIISDCRFPNEIDAWKLHFYDTISIHIERTGFDSDLTEEQKKHISETALAGHYFNHYISAEDVEQLQCHADFLVRCLS